MCILVGVSANGNRRSASAMTGPQKLFLSFQIGSLSPNLEPFGLFWPVSLRDSPVSLSRAGITDMPLCPAPDVGAMGSTEAPMLVQQVCVHFAISTAPACINKILLTKY